MLRSYIRMVLFALGLMVAVQVPGFIKDYAQRVDAHRIEAAQALEGFKGTSGQFFQGDLNALVAHYRGSPDPVFQRDADNIERLMRRAQLFENEWQALQGTWYQRAMHMVTAPNHELLQETYANYRYQVVLEPEAIGWALAGGLLLAWIAEVLMASVAALVGLGDNRRASRRHWS
ncbi:DUF2937 family protein [Pseudomonas sp. GD04087]|uniref:DUF2937 family protein n=1 Tax=unclassified Pseudomonas TaxID=196821 RepID=UPI002448282C|nr:MULTISPECIES: DUF2937 family protein [unclassified Pseudomonas]MDH0287539.1 DUF2937 family protein [Pseudomonas sp. GD04087]MDH1047763.1 DUF2937 family protein [Pseudomonas sp. GD03903]MDH2001116.1 DUF2937 family protein [Pseudomonas sp. GD03691]